MENTVSSTSRKEETIATKIHNKLIIKAQSLPSLPFDLIPEILCRLPVKLLLQLRCVCKSWNSLISDPKFAKKHLLLSTTHCINTCCSSVFLNKIVIKSYPFDSVFTDITTNHNVTYLDYNFKRLEHTFVGSCNGILCLANVYEGFYRLWNPSIKKFKDLPTIKNPQILPDLYGFGYDSVNDNYKVIVIFISGCDTDSNFVKFDLKIYTSGTKFWKSIMMEIPFRVYVPFRGSGVFVSGTFNWLVSKGYTYKSQSFIISLNLCNESYQEVSLPDHGERYVSRLYLGVLRDCLCLISTCDVWIMKEYGNKESWTKLFTMSYTGDPSKSCAFTTPVYISEDDQVLLSYFVKEKLNLILYNCRDGTFKVTEFGKAPYVCVESLISPCF